MAKRKTQSSRTTSKAKTSPRARSTSASKRSSSASDRPSSSDRSFNLKDIKSLNKNDVTEMLQKLRSNPIALSVAGGVGALFLARFAYRYYRNHPEFREFIKENFDTVEHTLKEYRQGQGVQDESAEARH